MKTREEIEQLAAREHWNSNIESRSFIKGYTKCQEDMANKKYTEEDVINLMFMATKWDTFKDGDVEYEMDMDDFFKYLINLLNKQN